MKIYLYSSNLDSQVPLNIFASSKSIEAEEGAKEERFESWLAYSVRAVTSEKIRNLSSQTSTSPSWIFQDPDFVSWMKTTDGCDFLWLSGTSDYGKSVLAAYLTNALVERFPFTPITYVFCKDNMFLQEAHHIVRVILYHLASQSPKTRAIVKQPKIDRRINRNCRRSFQHSLSSHASNPLGIIPDSVLHPRWTQ